MMAGMSTRDDAAGTPTPRRGRAREGFTLDRFLKYEGLAETGGMAKVFVQEGAVLVNGEVETRRRRQLSPGDVVCFDGEERTVPGPRPESDPEPGVGLADSETSD